LKRAKESGEPYLHYQVELHSEVRSGWRSSTTCVVPWTSTSSYSTINLQVNIATAASTQLKALLRWNDPQGGLTLPGRFLHVLESSGMIVAVGDWVLRQAPKIARWSRAGLGPIRIAVNVSAQQIRRRAFVENCLAAASSCTIAG